MEDAGFLVPPLCAGFVPDFVAVACLVVSFAGFGFAVCAFMPNTSNADAMIMTNFFILFLVFLFVINVMSNKVPHLTSWKFLTN